MQRLGILATVVVITYLFGHFVPVVALKAALQPAAVAVSILLAAVFVRLSRGLPTLDWKEVPPGSREQLTENLVSISVEYVGVLAIGLMALVGLVLLAGVSTDLLEQLHRVVQQAIAAVFGALFSLLLCRMGYVVWRDLDIIRLQKAIVDNMPYSTPRGSPEDILAGSKKLEAMRESNLRGGGTPKRNAW